MNTLFILKDKNAERVVYSYRMDSRDAPNDGEIEFDIKTEAFKLLRAATGDGDGARAGWFCFPQLRSIFRKEGFPERRFIAVG